MNVLVAIVVLSALIVMVGLVAIAARVSWKLTHPPRKPINMDPQSFGINLYDEITFNSRDQAIKLSGWYFSAEANGYKSNGSTLILAHGYSQNRQEPHLPALSLANKLLIAGFDILMFDFRNAGLSQGKLTTIGLYEQNDLLGAIDYVSDVAPKRKIGLIGFSMGAATSLMVAERDHRVQAVVADSPFFSLREYLQENLPGWTGLPARPFNWLILTFSPIMLRADPQDVNPYLAVKGFSPKPILFIHGTGDDTVPHGNSERLFSLADGSRTELWLVPEAGHVRSYARHPEEYAQKVIDFFERAM